MSGKGEDVWGWTGCQGLDRMSGIGELVGGLGGSQVFGWVLGVG